MQQEDRAEGVTLGEVFRIILKRIWWVLGAAVVCALAVVLIVHFAINPARVSYSMRYELVYPTQAEEKYPDGTPFSYQKVVERENLNALRSQSRFSSINVDKMYQKDDISITAERTEGQPTRYTIQVKGGYFSGEGQAEEFIVALAASAKQDILNNAAALDYKIDAATFAGASFAEQLRLLEEQKETLVAQYESWIGIYHPAYAVDGKTLANRLAEVRVVYGESVQAELETTFKTSGYDGLDLIGYETVDAAIEARTAQLNSERALNVSILKQFGVNVDESGVPVSGSTLDGELANILQEYITRNAEIDFQLKNTLKPDMVQAFADRLSAQYAALAAAADTANQVTESIYSANTEVRFEKQTVTQTGGMNAILMGIVAFVLVLIVGAIIAYVAESARARRKALKEGGAADNAEQDEPKE